MANTIWGKIPAGNVLIPERDVRPRFCRECGHELQYDEGGFLSCKRCGYKHKLQEKPRSGLVAKDDSTPFLVQSKGKNKADPDIPSRAVIIEETDIFT